MTNRRSLLSGMFCLLLGTSACTVQPLYGDRSSPNATNQVSVEPTNSRAGQQVRNRLLFLLNGSGAQPDQPAYNAALNITSRALGILSVRTADGSDVSARRVQLTGVLTLKDATTSETVASYERIKFASYDTSSQSFANSRALIDAENRAATEMAEEFRNLILSYTAGR